MAKQVNPANRRFNFKEWAHEQWEWGIRMDSIFRHTMYAPRPRVQPIRVNREFPTVKRPLLTPVPR